MGQRRLASSACAASWTALRARLRADFVRLSRSTETHMNWVPTVAIGLSAALLLGTLARRLGLSPLVGYLCAGMAVGPHTPGFVGDMALASQLADVGVILLMFGVGLNFSLRDLLAVRGVALPGALLASAAAMTCGAAIGLANDWGLAASMVFGLCLATASTVVIVRGLLELDMLGSAAGRIAVGWSVVEDLVTVVVLVLLPALAAQNEAEPLLQVLLQTAGAIALLAVLVFSGGAWLVPRLLGIVARAQSRELFTLAVLVLALGVAWLAAEVFGTSIALGAFLGGMLVGQSDMSHQAAADALPLRDAFAVLFFVAVGMLVDPMLVVDQPGLVFASLAAVLLAKPAVALLVLLTRGFPLGTSLSVAAAISQVSEFSFVLAGLAVSLDVLPEQARSVVLATALLSIVASPLLFRGAQPLERRLLGNRRVARFVMHRAGRLAKLPIETAESLVGHAVLCGYGRVGSELASFLSARGITYVVIEQARTLVDELRAQRVPVLFGDAGSPTLLDRARVASARSLLLSVPDPVTARLAIEHARRVNPEIEVIVRVHADRVGGELARHPSVRSVHGERELAYAMARLALQGFGVSAIEAEAAVIDRRHARGGASQPTRIAEIHVPASSPVVGRSVVELGIPRGVLVVTIARDGEFVVPSGDTEVRAGDALLVLADTERARAVERLVREG
ncbi:MAG: sodium:proton antiporter [Planctomycetota bacterium]|nr:MAG: sodium:proton antiporter [Planctomycetota bacterium]